MKGFKEKVILFGFCSIFFLHHRCVLLLCVVWLFDKILFTQQYIRAWREVLACRYSCSYSTHPGTGANRVYMLLGTYI